MGIVRESPPYAHARGMKGGERVDKRWSSLEKKTHLMLSSSFEEATGSMVQIDGLICLFF